ncbi:MAG: hypothetical protein MUE49_06575 [Rhodospirillales bacterium]|jgi:hypothetical protein|nr:hypothetical protein [Rhodospirillales bacterium]
MANTAVKYAGALALGVIVGLTASDAQAKTVFLYGFPGIAPATYLAKGINATVPASLKSSGDIVPPASDVGTVASSSVTSLALFSLAMAVNGPDIDDGVPAVGRITPFAVPTVPIPVPAALPILAAALAGFGFAGWRLKRNAA